MNEEKHGRRTKRNRQMKGRKEEECEDSEEAD